MPDADRYKISVRGARAYVAGFGTSGSLLAGAAVLFVLGSAIVAFRGWPQIATGPATSNVSAAPVAVASRDARRLDVVLATTRLHRLTGRGVVGGRLRRAGGVHRSQRGVRTVTSQPGAGAPGSGSTSAGGGSGGSPAAGGSSGCGSCGGSTPQNPIVTLTNSVTRTVSNVGTDVGRQIIGLGGAVAGPVSAANRQAGSALGSAGSSLGNGVSGTVTSAGNGVSTTVDNLAGGGGH